MSIKKGFLNVPRKGKLKCASKRSTKMSLKNVFAHSCSITYANLQQKQLIVLYWTLWIHQILTQLARDSQNYLNFKMAWT